MDGWLNFPKSRPRRPAAGGTPARSRRGGIGESWWSRRFLAVLESFSLSNRLSRGRSYARSGQVSNLAVRPMWVTAAVQGSRRKPYDVWIEVPRLSDERWDRVEEVLVSQAGLLAALLAGEIPAEIEEVFAAAGASLFPASPGELAMQCSCPDYANPCKHVAAAFYLLAEAFDRDPFLIFAWRGRDRETLITSLRERRAQLGSDARSGGETGEEEAESGSLPLDAGLFWGASEAGAALHFDPRAPEVPDLLLQTLDPVPVYPDDFDGQAFLSAAYRELTAAAEGLASRGD
jgi:uncharacterized Zn finger protein